MTGLGRLNRWVGARVARATRGSTVKRLTEATAGSLAPGEDLLVAGAATTGPPSVILWGPFVAGIAVMFGGDKVPALGPAGLAMMGSTAVLAVMLYGNASVALTTRRLIVFRSTKVRRRLKLVLVDVPRSQVFVQKFGLSPGAGWVTLVLGFHNTRRGPMRLIFWTTFIHDGKAIHAALTSVEPKGTERQVAGAISATTGRAAMLRRSRRKPGIDSAPSDVYEGARRLILDLNPAEAGISPSPTLPQVWGLLMDTWHREGGYTLVALADGTTSLYVSTGGGVIGGGGHAQVASATRRLLEVVEQHLADMPTSTDTRLPQPDRVALRALTYHGRRGGDAAADDLGLGRHPLSPVFLAAHDVITQLHLLTEARLE